MHKANCLWQLSLHVRKSTFGHVAQRRFRSACAFAQSDQNLHWAHFRYPRMKSFIMSTTETLIILRGCAGWFESSLGTRQKVHFLTFRLKWLLALMQSSWWWIRITALALTEQLRREKRTTKTQISLRIRAVWSKPSFFAFLHKEILHPWLSKLSPVKFLISSTDWICPKCPFRTMVLSYERPRESRS